MKRNCVISEWRKGYEFSHLRLNYKVPKTKRKGNTLLYEDAQTDTEDILNSDLIYGMMILDYLHYIRIVFLIWEKKMEGYYKLQLL